ncbi:MAG: AAA family ATPase [candidate division WOR-3 bacterium]
MFKKGQIDSAKKLLSFIAARNHEEMVKASLELLREMFGQSVAENAENNGLLRHQSILRAKDHVSYWGILAQNAPLSGTYENFSLVVFPEEKDEPSQQLLLCFGIGTGGITDDAERLRMPWVSRYARSLLRLVRKNGWVVDGTRTFAKDDFADIQLPIDEPTINSLGNFANHESLWRAYSKYLPTACVISPDDKGAWVFLAHLLLYGKFREWKVLKAYYNIFHNELIPALVDMARPYPKIEELVQFVRERKYVILQGPPGTGKSYLAKQVAVRLMESDKITCDVIQFHSSFGYDDFVEGFRPDVNKDQQLYFVAHEGAFVRGLESAANGKGHLLIIDEINRGDLSRILGEAIYLLEPGESRTVRFRSGKERTMPDKFYLLGTMNTADRSIALLDFAIRRRFAFIDVWPSAKQLDDLLATSNLTDSGKQLAKGLFAQLQSVFFELATDEDAVLQPGHTYFWAVDDGQLRRRLKYELAPLLCEYIREGRLTLARNEINQIIDKLEDVEDTNQDRVD